MRRQSSSYVICQIQTRSYLIYTISDIGRKIFSYWWCLHFSEDSFITIDQVAKEKSRPIWVSFRFIFRHICYQTKRDALSKYKKPSLEIPIKIYKHWANIHCYYYYILCCPNWVFTYPVVLFYHLIKNE